METPRTTTSFPFLTDLGARNSDAFSPLSRVLRTRVPYPSTTLHTTPDLIRSNQLPVVVPPFYSDFSLNFGRFYKPERAI